jgi:hypothetical protein
MVARTAQPMARIGVEGTLTCGKIHVARDEDSA